MYLKYYIKRYTRRRLGGRQPLCGNGVTSTISVTSIPAPWIDRGQIHVICVDGIDGETWSNRGGDCRSRIELHEKWFHYIMDELLPSLQRTPEETFIVTGCSMGGFHAGNFFFRRPDVFDTLIALSGLYHAAYGFGNYHDELTYANSPEDFLANMPEDHPWMQRYRQHPSPRSSDVPGHRHRRNRSEQS